MLIPLVGGWTSMKIHLPLILMFTRFPTFFPVGPISEPGRAGDSSGSDSHFGVGSPRRIGDGKVSNSPFGSNFSVLDASYTVRIIVLLYSIVFYCIFYIYIYIYIHTRGWLRLSPCLTVQKNMVHIPIRDFHHCAGPARLAGHRTGVRALAVAQDDSMRGDLEWWVGNHRGSIGAIAIGNHRSVEISGQHQVAIFFTRTKFQSILCGDIPWNFAMCSVPRGS